MSYLRTLTFLCLSYCAIAQTSQSLTNKDVINMTTIGLPANLIIAKIKKTGGKFDTSSIALKELKDANVHEEVLLFLIDSDQSKTQVDAKKNSPLHSLALTKESANNKGEKEDISKPISAIFQTSLRQAKSALLKQRIADGWQLQSESDLMFGITKPMQLGDAIKYRLGAGQKNSRSPVWSDRFTFIEDNGQVTIIADTGYESFYMAGHSDRTSSIRDKKSRQDVKELFAKLTVLLAQK